MPKLDKTPDKLRPYMFHGLNLSWKGGDSQAVGDCIFCGREGKFAVNVETGLWRCYVCAEGTEKGGGNAYTFIRKLWEGAALSVGDEGKLAVDRKVQPDTVSRWGIKRHPVTDEYCVPGFGPEGKLNQLYRYVRDALSNRMKLLPTPTLEHALHMPADRPARPDTVFVCEGPWDGMALWEAARGLKESGSELVATANVEASVGARALVVAVPGCSVFREAWLPLFAGKRVVLLYDSDRPRANPKTGKESPPAGLTGMKAACRKLASKPEHAPASVEYLEWGPAGWDPDLPSGYDVRDHLNNGVGKAAALADVLRRIKPVPSDWIAGRSKASVASGSTEVELLECRNWRTLTQAWRRALRWTDGLDRALAVMLAAILSTEGVGDQLWVKIIGPASCGKSTLAEAVSLCKKYVLAKSTIRGFHSGYRETTDDKEDNSLIALVRNRALVTKDGDTLLQSPNLPQILSEARDVYDRVSRTHYRNKASKDYHGCSMPWILLGTESLRALDASELGERFVDCVVVERIDDDEERATAMRVARRTAANRATKMEVEGDTSDSPEITEAKRLTGGYVRYLRDNDAELLAAIPESDEALERCVDYATFVAYMRARPSTRQKEKAQREMSYRLTGQIVRLANCLAVVLNRRELDETVLGLVRAVALDTSRGRTLTLCRCMVAGGAEGKSSEALAYETGHDKAEEVALLKFLRRIGAAEPVERRSGTVKLAPGWRLTRRMRELYDRVVEGKGPNVA